SRESYPIFRRTKTPACLSRRSRLRDGGLALDSGRDPSLSVFRHSKLGRAFCHRGTLAWVSNRDAAGMALRIYWRRICSRERCRSGKTAERGASLQFCNHRRPLAPDRSPDLWTASFSELERRTDPGKKHRSVAICE